MLEGGAIDVLVPRPQSKPSLKVTNLEDLLAAELPPRDNLLGAWLPLQGLAMLYAPRGLGKTHVALGIAYAVASGGEFLTWKAPGAYTVLYLDGEMPANAMQERLAGIAASSTSTPPPDSLRIMNPDFQEWSMPDIGTAEGQDALEPHLDGVDLIIIDNISTLCRTGAENKADDWISVQEWALRQRSRGKSVLFVHHAGKGGAQRGTSKREDVLDTVISLRHPADYDPSEGARFEIHFEKARGVYGDDVRPMVAQMKTFPDGRTWWDVTTLEESTYDQVIALAKDGLTQKEIADELGINKSNVSRHMRRAKTEGRLGK